MSRTEVEERSNRLTFGATKGSYEGRRKGAAIHRRSWYLEMADSGRRWGVQAQPRGHVVRDGVKKFRRAERGGGGILPVTTVDCVKSRCCLVLEQRLGD